MVDPGTASCRKPFGRHRAQELAENRSFPVKSPAGTVLRKLQWYRGGGEVSESPVG